MARSNPFRHPKLQAITSRLPLWVFRSLDRDDPTDFRTMIEDYGLSSREGTPKDLDHYIIEGLREAAGGYVLRVWDLFVRPPYDERLEDAVQAIEGCLAAFNEDTISLRMNPDYLDSNPSIRSHLRSEVEKATGERLSDADLYSEFERMRTMLDCVKCAAKTELVTRERNGVRERHKDNVGKARKYRQSSTRLVVRGVRRALEDYADPEFLRPTRRDRIIWAVLQALGEDITNVSASTLARYWSEARKPLRILKI